jgi:hypothetical protein
MTRWLTLSLLLVPAAATAQQPASGQARPPVSGVVYDSVAGRPLRGASVQFIGAADSITGRSISAITDDEGKFAIQNVAPGQYFAGFFHPVLDSMGLEGVPIAVTVANAETTVELATPSARTIIGTICGEAAVADSIAMVLGHVHDTRTGMPLPGARVTAEWGETIIERGNVRMRNVSHSAGTVGPGWFALCDVPGGVDLTLSASNDADSSGFINIETPRGGLRHATFFVGGARRVPVALIDTITPIDSTVTEIVAEMIWRGDAQFTGIVRDENGRPVPSARVFVRGTNLSTTTTDRGYFSLDSLPGGTHSFEVRALGYLPTTSIVHLAEGRPANEEIFIGDRAVTLETVRVQATLVFSRNLARFQTNRERNPGGTFVGPREIERFRGMRFSNLLQGLPGVRLSYSNGFSVLMDYRGTDDGQSNGLCVPTIYLDGQRSQYTGSEIEGLYRAEELAGVEVYPRYSMRPMEFQDASSTCGAIVIWTRPQLRRPGGQPPPTR